MKTLHSVASRFAAAMLLPAIVSCRSTPPPAPRPASGTDVILELHNALPEKETVTVFIHVRNHVPTCAFALAPDYNTMPHVVLADAAIVESERMVGPILVTYSPDAWEPTNQLAWTAEYELELEGRERSYAGAHRQMTRGKRGGAIAIARSFPASSVPPEATLTLRIENALPIPDASLIDTNTWRRRAWITLPLVGGRQRGAAAMVNRAPEHGWSAPVRKLRLHARGPHLSASLTSVFDGQTYRYELEGLLIAGRMAGSVAVSRGEEAICRGVFEGSIIDRTRTERSQVDMAWALEQAREIDERLREGMPWPPR